MNLTEEQIASIRAVLIEEGMQHESLTDDVLDHICCVVELLLKRGKNFDEALNEAIDDLAPNGLKDLEIQTRYLLNSKRIMIMKKLMFSAGFIGAVLISIGSLFKIMHWPMANVMMISGMIAFLLLFVPLFALDRYKVQASKAMSTKVKISIGFISTFLIGLSVVFKLMHWMGASVMLVVGVGLFTFGFLPFLFFSLYKKSVS
jgi:cation transport ATPase